MISSVRVITAPQQEPVSLAEARGWCRIDDDLTDQDAVLVLLIIAMREYAEELTLRAFVPRTLEMVLDKFPLSTESQVISLPYAPLIAVQSVSYLDEDGTLQVMSGSPSEFQADTTTEPGRIAPLPTQTWPATQVGALSAVRVRYTVGYPSMTAIPRKLKLWMEARMATLFEQREQLVTGTIVNPIPRDFVDGLLDSLVSEVKFA